MEAALEWIGPLTPTTRAIIGLVVALVLFVVLVALTSLLVSWRRALAGWLVVAVAGALVILYAPVDTEGLVASPDPIDGYDAAVARFESDLLPSPEPLNPLCEPYILSHGEKTGKAVVLLHGVSSCPQAFVDFAPLVHERGHNVLVVRMPQNGYADRATDALRFLTAEQLAEFGDDVVDTAAGLGEEVVFLGISAGGTVAGWAAQNRPEVDRAVLVAPFYGLGDLGPRINVGLMRAMLILPDISMWKDPIERENAEGGMPHAYKRQSTRGTGEIMRLGLATWRQAREAPPATEDIVVVTNDADEAVSNATTDVLVGVWRESGAEVTEYAFAAEHDLGHELIDPMEPGADPALTYPVILDLIEDPSAVAAASSAAPD